MNSKQRAYLKSLACTMNHIFQEGKASLTPENVTAIDEALEKWEFVKVLVLRNCIDDSRIIAEAIGERTHYEVVQVIGKKMIFYCPSKKDP